MAQPEGFSKFAKLAIGFGVLVTAGISLLFFQQDKLLYIPNYPIKHARDNPQGYRSPLDRQMKFQEVEIKVDGPTEPERDGVHKQLQTYVKGVDTVLRGWYIFKDPVEQ